MNTDDARTFSELPPFDRRFFEGSESITRIGPGALGGKASGLAFIREFLRTRLDVSAFPSIEIGVPRMAVIATDFFDQFVTENQLGRLLIDELPDDHIARAFQNADLPVELVGDLRALTDHVHRPLAVRSSSLLEDALYRPFAGVYATKMIPNNHFDPNHRFRHLIEAIKFVFASTWFREAREYIRAAERLPGEEKMAVIIQEVVGREHRGRFYPELSGVARSYNFYPMSGARPDEGVVDLALGLGKTIVDGEIAWTYSPASPERTPPFGGVREMLAATQSRFWAVNMGDPPNYDPVNEVEYLVSADLAAAEEDETLRFVASTYDPARERVTFGLDVRGPRVLNFAPLLVLEEVPLNALVRQLLAVSEEACHAKVEIEFAMTFDARRGAAPRARLGFLQVRPMVVSDALVDIEPDELAGPRVLLASEAAMGNGADDTIHDVVFVRPDQFEPLCTPIVAREIAAINHGLAEARRPYLLIGFGRWGSSHPSLGIPVNWSEISGARAIVEATLPTMNVEPSQGSHFFHNLSSFRVSYFTVHHEGRYRIDWAWLHQQALVCETKLVRHVRLTRPLNVRVDGRTARGVILRQ